jgi:hypothetical protein
MEPCWHFDNDDVVYHAFKGVRPVAACLHCAKVWNDLVEAIQPTL